tara:strand:- start:3039 stop:3530 length:492 start_codon:yes stop_codon:yes gene_type:complete
MMAKRERKVVVNTNDLTHQLRQSALIMLSRREYSRAGLEQRLGRVEGSESLLPALLEQLQQQGLQSDLRYTESLLRSRINRGQGPVRIAQELRHKGLADQLSDEVMSSCEQDWFELARTVRERRFGLEPPQDRQAEAKQWRFLLYRGFTSEQARYAMRARESG